MVFGVNFFAGCTQERETCSEAGKKACLLVLGEKSKNTAASGEAEAPAFIF